VDQVASRGTVAQGVMLPRLGRLKARGTKMI
jgi:hypothetical protein